ncbi:MAG: SAM-dependent methyltransferase [Acidimicrobiia bacterium]|nr:MAG: SAM-dependent methyltransferase [Acidimicrobiia bacterium]
MRERIIARIKSDGPMPFDEYMEMCLYDPDDGFFAAGPVRSGRKGDFVTSPEISWALGVPVGEWVDANVPSAEAVLVEVGAGAGSLLGEVADLWFAGGYGVFAVERSIEARRLLAERYPDATVVESLDEVPAGIDAVIVANEVLDNMPAALARRTDDGWVEIAVRLESDELSLVEIPARDDVVEWCDETFGDVEPGTTVSVQLAIADWIERVFNHFGAVTMCLIDYGGKSAELAGRHPSSVVRTYRRHQDGLDWLQHPGYTDITVDVNFTGVVKAIARAGRKARLMSQRDFCLEQGLGELIADTKYSERLAASSGEIMTQLENRSDRLDMEALIDPLGFGAFNVILVEWGSTHGR